MKYLRKISLFTMLLFGLQAMSLQGAAEIEDPWPYNRPDKVAWVVRNFPQYQEAFYLLESGNPIARKQAFSSYLFNVIPLTQQDDDFNINDLVLNIENTIATAMKPTVMAALQQYNPDFIHNFDLASVHTMQDLSPTKPFDNIIHDHNPIIQYVRKYSDTNLQSKSAFMQPIINEWVREWIINTPDEGDRNRTLLQRTIAQKFKNENQRMHIIKLLINAGADLNIQDDLRNTALIYTVMWNKTDIAQSLINAGADLNAQNNLGETALICAILVSRTEIVQLLINARANFNLQDNLGSTALMIAVMWNKTDIAQSLINTLADITIQNNDGITAADYAESPEMRALFNLPPL